MLKVKKFKKSVRNGLLVAACVLLTSYLPGCAPVDAVATFASNAQKSLENGTAVFDDIPASVVRRDCFANTEYVRLDFEPVSEACVKDATEQQNLADAKSDRDSLVAVQQILIDYFSGIQQLAEFGKSSDSGSKGKSDSSGASSAASKLNKKSGPTHVSKDEADTIVSLATLAERLLTAGYRSRELSKDLDQAGKDIPVVIDALKRIVQDDYMFHPDQSDKPSLLNLEAHRMQQVYRDAHGDQLLLKISWTDHVTKLLARNSSAQSYIEALDKIQAGQQELTSKRTHLKAQDVAAALQPYISSLGSLIPKIQKVF